jgi:hypothetical protein
MREKHEKERERSRERKKNGGELVVFEIVSSYIYFYRIIE